MLKMSSQGNHHEEMRVIIKIEDSDPDEHITLTTKEANQSTASQCLNNVVAEMPKLTVPEVTKPTTGVQPKKKKKKKRGCRGAQRLISVVPSLIPGGNSLSNNCGNNSSVRVNKTSLVDTTQVIVNKVQYAVNATSDSIPTSHHDSDGVSCSIGVEYMKHVVSSTMSNSPKYIPKECIRVGIAADPPRVITESDVIRIKTLVRDKILENVEKNGFAPHFKGRPQIFNGLLSVLCEDVETYNWLCRTVPNLPAIHPGYKLCVRVLSEIPGFVKAGLLLPDCQDGLKKAQQILSHCNPWAQVNSWCLVKVDVQKDKMFLTLNIPANVVPNLLEKNRRLSYLLGSVYVKFFGPKEKLYNTPPPEKMKEIENIINREISILELDKEKYQQIDQNKQPTIENSSGFEQVSLDVIVENETNCDNNQQNLTNSQWSIQDESRDRSPIGYRSRRNAERSICDIEKGKGRPRSRDRGYQRSPERNRDGNKIRRSRSKSNERYGDKRYKSTYDSRDRYEHGNRHEARYCNDRRDERPHDDSRASYDRTPRREQESDKYTSNEGIYQWADDDNNYFQMPTARRDERLESHGSKQWSNYDNDDHTTSTNDRNRLDRAIETIVNAYKTLAKMPSVAGAKLNNAGNKLTAKWSVRNLDKGKNTKYSNNYILDGDFKVIAQSDFGTDISNELLSAVSPKETYKALIREEKNGKDAKKQYLEVWNKTSLQHCIDLTALDLHGDVYADSEFGSLDWAQDESAVVYVAEKKKPKSEPYIKRKGEDKASNGGSGEPAPKKGEEFLYRQDWGEQLEGKFYSVVVVCRLPAETVSVLDHLPEGCCAGQVRFSPDGGSIVGVAWETEPRRLGLIFCTNRPSYIFSLTLDGSYNNLSKAGLAVRSPRYRPNGDLVWLQRSADGPHHACHQLVMKKSGQDEITTLIDIVQTEIQISNGKFHGIYCLGLPLDCFTSDGNRLVFSTPQETQVRSYVFDIDSRTITDISNRQIPGSTSVLDVKNNIIVSTFTNMTTPGQIYIAKLPPKGSEAGIEWSRVSEPVEVPTAVVKATVNYMTLRHDNDDDVKTFTALHLMPDVGVDKKIPLVVWPHGGPHSAFVDAYSVEAALFAILGFSSVQINYRGSIGAGQSSVYYLPTRVGNADVIDCKMAADNVIQNYPINEKNVFLTGGSHGGFLVTHLSGQYPDMFRAVVTRNPVIDVAVMFNYTDINDWCAVEAGIEFTEKGPISEEHLLTMRRCSPIAHVHKVRAPTALMLGSGDKRVPHYQGLEYARRLKANGVETKVYIYEDNHSLSSLPSEMDNLINGAHWFLTHLNK